jgi:hypothetical protein
VRTMFDSTTPSAIPTTAVLVAGYVDGKWAWKPADWTRWPPAARATITINARNHHAIILDIENGDARPEQANAWVIGAGPATGWVPTLYGARGVLEVTRRFIVKAGLDCDWAVADPTGVPHLPRGYAVCQYAWPNAGSPGHYDMSVVADWWPRRVGTPRPI